MSNGWGRPPKNDFWNDLRSLALWIFIIGVVGYLLFPDFFHNVYNHLAVPAATQNTELGEVTLSPEESELPDPYQLPNVYQSLYTGDSEISDGYWAIFVVENEFVQLSLNPDSYSFILKLIDLDRKAEVKRTLLLAADGRIRKYVVSEEVYGIVTNINKIKTRSGGI
ncbi:MAG: hypothetical protein ACOX7U_02600 [Desulfitobacteriia bacterium]